MSPSAKGVARDAARNPVFRVLARCGFAVNGMLHILIGLIAIGVALPGVGGGEADQSGALRQLAHTPGGLFVIWASVVALLALALFQFVSLPLLRAHGGLRTAGRRISEAGKGVVYLVLGATALIFALGGSTSGTDTSRGVSAGLLGTPGGVFVLGALGLTVLGFGIGFVSIGVRRSFRPLIHVPSGAAGRAVVALGAVGYIANGVGLGVVGVLVVVAAVTTDAGTAAGLDGALRALTGLPFGVALLVAAGAGFIAYGLFLVARARLARL